MTFQNRTGNSKHYIVVSMSAWLILALLGAAYFQFEAHAQKSQTTLEVRSGQDLDGMPTQEWMRAILVFNDENSLRQISQTSSPFTDSELKWAKMIERRAELWPNQIEQLRAPFSGIAAPNRVAIILGNIGGNDAFISENRNIAFDLSRLLLLYGPGDTPSNIDRLDRIFAHEFTHLLHKQWRTDHRPVVQSPLETALWICLTEGLGNYRSLSARWADPDGSLSAHAQEVLLRLQPIFVERLSLLAAASDDEAENLMKGLSMGPFDEKWGALPVALWLSQEAISDEYALRSWIDAGPWGILVLASKYLPDELAAQLPEIQNKDRSDDP